MVRGRRQYIRRLSFIYCLIAFMIFKGPSNGTCHIFSGGTSTQGRSAMASLLWRLRHTSLAERAVAKYTVFTSRENTNPHIVLQKLDMIGIGVKMFCQYLSSIGSASRAFVWGVTEGADGVQAFIKKYFKARELVGKSVVAADVFRHIQFVLDGYVPLLVKDAVSRFIGEQFEAFKTGITVFSSDVSEALLQHDTRRLIEIFREGIPPMVSSLRLLLRFCDGVPEEHVLEPKVLVFRGIDKLFILDSTLLAMSANAPERLLDARRDLLGDSLTVTKGGGNVQQPLGDPGASGAVNVDP